MLRRSVGGALLAALIALGAACSEGDGDAPTPAPTTSPATPTATAGGATTTPSVASTTAQAGSPTAESTITPVAPLPTAVGAARILRRGDASRRAVTLTFDAGSDVGHTAAILATLRQYGVRAAFGITGTWAEANPDALLSIAAEGHILVNHGYSHASFTGSSTGAPPLSAAERALELQRTETTVYRITSRSTRPYMRPPYGDIDAALPADVAAAGYSVVAMWTVDTFGWRRISADEIVDRSLSLAEPGAIYIMHVGSESQDAGALPRIIEGLRAAGYAIVALDEIE